MLQMSGAHRDKFSKHYCLFVCLFNFYFMFVPLRAELFFNSSNLFGTFGGVVDVTSASVTAVISHVPSM